VKLGKAYKLAAMAASHKAKAVCLLEKSDHEAAKKQEIAYLDCVENIPSQFPTDDAIPRCVFEGKIDGLR